MTAKHITLIAVSACIVGSVSLADPIVTPIQWRVERSRPAKFNIPIKRGESIDILPLYSDYGTAVDLSSAIDIGLYYRQTGDPNLYLLAGTTTTNTGELVFHWTPAAELTNNSYSYEIMFSGLTNTSIRQEGTITMLPNLGYEAPATNPSPIRIIDCATVQWLNTGRAPTNIIKYIPGPQGPVGPQGPAGQAVTNITISIVTNLNQTIMSMTVTNITIGGGGAGNYTNTEINGVAHTNGVRIGDSVNSTWTIGTDGVWRVDMSTNQLQWVVNGEHIGGVDSNGITLLKGTLELWEEDLDCNVRLYDGTRITPSLTFNGHPGEWGIYARGYNGHYVAGWSVASNEVGILHAGGIKLMTNSAAFEGRLIGDISGATNCPEASFWAWRSNMTFQVLTISNLTVTPGNLDVKDINQTTRSTLDSAGGLTLRNAANIIRSYLADGILYLKDSMGRTRLKLESEVTIYEPVSGQPYTILNDALVMKTPAGIMLAGLDKYNGLRFYNEALPGFPTMVATYQSMWLYNSSSQLVWTADALSSKIVQQDTSITNSGNITFYGPNGTNLLTLTGVNGNITSKGLLTMVDTGGTNWLTASNRTLNVTGNLRMNGVQGPTGFYTNLTIGSKTQVWMMASGIITNIVTL